MPLRGTNRHGILGEGVRDLLSLGAFFVGLTR